MSHRPGRIATVFFEPSTPQLRAPLTTASRGITVGGMSTLISRNPATGAVLKEIPEMPLSECVAVVDKVREAFEQWRSRSCSERAGCCSRLASVLRDQRDDLASLITAEMGKPIVQSRAEVEKCAWACDYFAEHSEAFLKEEAVTTEARWSGVVHRPLGVILAIMPWNFPFWQVFRACIPALMAGNTVVLKHAENVPQCALTLEGLFHEAEFPTHVFRTVPVTKENAPALLVHDAVAGVTVTGSVETGRTVAAQAGSLLKRCVLELGGSDPYLILADADVAAAAVRCAESRMVNNGQSCIAAKRFIAVDPIREEFEARFMEAMSNYRPAPPDRSDCTLGPLARPDLRERLHDQVARSLDEGAVLRMGGTVPEGAGLYYPPTILGSVETHMTAAREELFGPVAAILPAADEEEAIALANTSPFGLGAAVFTRDLRRGEQIARERLEAGFCCVNDLVKSDPRLPFGGIRQSGIGRELGRAGILEFVNSKTVVVQ